jgi:TatD DNase family protein
MLVDTHAHLDAHAFEADREEVIARAWTAGLGAIISVGADVESSRQAIALAKAHPGVYATVGTHPHEASQAGPDALVELERLASENAVLAIGEIGLDLHYNFSPPAVQEECFVAQLELARRVNKPVVIHDREAHAKTLAILRVWRRSGPLERAPGVLHCFSGDREMAEQVMQMGFYLSFGGPITFTNARRLQELVRALPLDRVLLETDCPYLAPHPHRGKRNEPAYVRLVALQLAALKGLSLEQVASVTTANAQRLFRLGTL